MLPFRGLSVTFVHCAQTAEDIDTISFAHNSSKCLSQILLNLAYIGLSLSPQMLPQVTHTPC